MNDPVTAQEDLKSEEQDAGSEPEPMCPMASMCGGIFKRSPSRFLLMLPGVLLVLIGIAIVMQPQVLVWLAAAVAVLLGVGMLVMANLVHSFGKRIGASGQ
jgi:Flp pilus assembly protein TadB